MSFALFGGRPPERTDGKYGAVTRRLVRLDVSLPSAAIACGSTHGRLQTAGLNLS